MILDVCSISMEIANDTTFTQQPQVAPTKECDSEVLETLRYTIWRANVLFDILYSHGVFIPPAKSAEASRACMDFCEACRKVIYIHVRVDHHLVPNFRFLLSYGGVPLSSIS